MRKAAAVLLALALLLVFAGCGGTGVTSLSEYRERISELHDHVVGSLDFASDELSSLSYGDYYDLRELQGVFGGVNETFRSAKKEADAMRPPPEVEALYEDLVTYYAHGENDTGDIANALGFFRAVLPMLTDVENLALPNLPEDAEVSRIKAASTEDGKTMHDYIKDLSGMEPPKELRPYRDKLVAFFRSIEEAVAGVERAITPGDRSAFLQFQREFPTVLEGKHVLEAEITVYLRLMGKRIDYLIAKGEELATRIQDLQAYSAPGVHGIDPGNRAAVDRELQGCGVKRCDAMAGFTAGNSGIRRLI